MAVTGTGETRLGCGRDLDDLWDRIDQAPDQHEQHCPDCQAARRDLAALAAATTSMRSTDEHDTKLQPRSHLLDAVMSVARAEVRRGRRVPLRQAAPQDVDELTISEQTIAQIIRDTCDRLPGIEARRIRLEVDDSRPESADRTSRLRVDLTISVRSDLSIPAAGEQIRDAIRSVLDRETGVHVTRIDIRVEDLHDV